CHPRHRRADRQRLQGWPDSNPQVAGGAPMTALPFAIADDGSTTPSLTPDLSEAERLLDLDFFLVELHPYQKRPMGDNWNKHQALAINRKATGYGMPLAANNLCSIDPDQVQMARAGLAAWGFDL